MPAEAIPNYIQSHPKPYEGRNVHGNRLHEWHLEFKCESHVDAESNCTVYCWKVRAEQVFVWLLIMLWTCLHTIVCYLLHTDKLSWNYIILLYYFGYRLFMLQFEFIFWQESYSISSKLYVQESVSRDNVAVAHMSVYIFLILICMTFFFFHKKACS